MPDDPPREPTFFRPGELDDLALLPRRFDMLESEVRSGFEILSIKLLPFMERVERAITDIALRVSELERARRVAEDLHKGLVRRVIALEGRPKRKRA
jgi:hypothetical protein